MYDALNRVTTETDPLGVSATFAYDAAGRFASTTDRLGRRRDFAYDDAGRQTTEKWYASGGSLVQTQTLTYDAAWRVLTAQDPDGTYTLAYDDANRVTSVQEPFGLILTMGYDANGNRTSVADSKGGTTTVAFDALNRQASEQVGVSGGSAMRFDTAYTERGEVASLTRYSDLAGTSVVGTTAYLYDDAGRQTNIQSTKSDGTILANYTYTYDAADRLTAKIENGTTTSFGYDLASQLTADGAATFGYDATGNRTNAGYATTTGNRTTNDGTWTYTYDAEGNVTKRSKGSSSDTWVYTYDHRNQMLTAEYSATDGGTVTTRVTYAYDALGNRIERQGWDGSTSTTTRYGVDGWDPAKPRAIANEGVDAWVDLDGSNAVVVRRAWGPRFDEAVARQTAGGTVAWYLADRQGSVRQVIDNSGSVLGSVEFTAYGAVASGSVYDGLGYNGVRVDALTGLQSHGDAREYDPGFGKWYQPDPILADPANTYRYVFNSPTAFTDPSGLDIFDRLYERGSAVANRIGGAAQNAWNGSVAQDTFNYANEQAQQAANYVNNTVVQPAVQQVQNWWNGEGVHDVNQAIAQVEADYVNRPPLAPSADYLWLASVWDRADELFHQIASWVYPVGISGAGAVVEVPATLLDVDQFFGYTALTAWAWATGGPVPDEPSWLSSLFLGMPPVNATPEQHQAYIQEAQYQVITLGLDELYQGGVEWYATGDPARFQHALGPTLVLLGGLSIGGRPSGPRPPAVDTLPPRPSIELPPTRPTNVPEWMLPDPIRYMVDPNSGPRPPAPGGPPRVPSPESVLERPQIVAPDGELAFTVTDTLLTGPGHEPIVIAPPPRLPIGAANRLVPGGGLAVHEVAGGHTIARHVGRTDAQLAARLTAEPHIPAASTFPDLAMAERAIAEALDVNAATVQTWLAGAQQQLNPPLRATLPYTVGRTLPRGATSTTDVQSVLIVLRRDATLPTGYRIHTAYPVQ